MNFVNVPKTSKPWQNSALTNIYYPVNVSNKIQVLENANLISRKS